MSVVFMLKKACSGSTIFKVKPSVSQSDLLYAVGLTLSFFFLL